MTIHDSMGINLLSKPIQKQPVDIHFNKLYELIENFKSYEDQIVLSIILPMYNEENTVRVVLDSLPNHKSIEIIVINDHSTDRSLQEVRMVQKNRKIKLVNHDANKGYGAAILTGIKNAKGQVIVSMDSDGQHSSSDILTIIKPVLNGQADYTIGSRYLGTYFYKLPMSTRLGELFVEKLLHIFFGKKIMNNQNGFRAFNRKILKIFENVKFDGYAFCTEQILRASLEGYRIKECPIKVYNRNHGTSHIVLSKLGINILKLFFHYIVKKIQVTVIKRNKKGSLDIYEKPIKKVKELQLFKFNREHAYINSVVFIEPRTILNK